MDDRMRAAVLYLDRLHAAARPTEADANLRALDAVTGMGHLIATYAVGMGMGLDQLLDIVEDSYEVRMSKKPSVILGPSGEA